MSNSAKKSNPIFKLKGSLFTLTAMQILHNNLTDFSKQLADLIKLSPNFLQHAPIIIDFSELAPTMEDIDLHTLLAELRAHGLIPVGARGASEKLKDKIIANGLALLNQDSQAQKSSSRKTKDKDAEQEVTTLSTTKSKLIAQNVRSGQQVYAQGGDLIVLGTVSTGAEILADGHIHVYGNLRGRVLAGVMGDTNARIFCKSLEAELVSIAGRYLTSESLERLKTDHSPAQIYLEDDQITITSV